MPLSGPPLPTLQQAEDAAATCITDVLGGKLTSDENIEAAYICLGYGIVLKIGTPAADKPRLMAMPKGLSINWQQLILQILALLASNLTPVPVP